MKEREQNVLCEGFRKGSGVPTALPAMGLQIPKGPKGCGSSNSPELSNGGNRATHAPKADALISAGRS